MEYKLGQTEVNKVIALKPFNRYKYTVKEVAYFKLVYIIIHKDRNWVPAEVERPSFPSSQQQLMQKIMQPTFGQVTKR